ncbi:hypothetical protein [Carboxydothermus pertinax]|uniref:Plasmid stabilization protein n=1 Tax=Carboxydothermus pertinax TaxID=870242 RepID=A0A1L8CWQ8_9THEO|nr:hypothetical protein [Carboxydothermus pertinax]GAV23299.1 plasmid stabilization protein [Carboxydothermus pertinax]
MLVYQPIKSLDAEDRVLPVKSYLKLYVVTEDKVEIHGILDSNLINLIKLKV